ncbi:MAG: chromate transporter [Verrucomicrobiales bacterium]|nr:chromate transporter [Verrucomicrobiales bacterium]
MKTGEPSDAAETVASKHPTFAEAFRFWVKLGFISFGGPTGQIAIMHAELVEKKKWISDSRFLHALNYCMLLPGPEAQQLAIYIGWLLHRVWGGIVAGAFFVLPSMFILWLLSFVYVTYGNIPWVAAIFYGLKPAVLAIVASAVLRLGSKALKNQVMWAIAAAAFVGIYFFQLPFPVIIIVAALIGFIGGRYWKEKFYVLTGHGGKKSEQSVIDDETIAPAHAKPSLVRGLKVCAICLLLWWIPVLLLASWLGPNHALIRESIFFSKASMVTFGGAYAVLPYVSQQAVEHYQWLNAGQMLDGLGLAETTPGPLIMVLQFVGFLGGWNQHGVLSPLLAATIGAFITTWTTFVPCFLWIFLGAPHIEQLRGNVKLTTSLSAVTAAVVGVILNLAVWFGMHVLFPTSKIDWFAIIVSVLAFVGMTKWKWNIIPVILGAGAFGLIYSACLK